MKKNILSLFIFSALSYTQTINDVVLKDQINVYKNNHLIKAIKGEKFNKRLLQLWIGDAPVDKTLKIEILGDSKIKY